ncbi:hypothetical protein D3C72_1977790 [compost metagenome]
MPGERLAGVVIVQSMAGGAVDEGGLKLSEPHLPPEHEAISGGEGARFDRHRGRISVRPQKGAAHHVGHGLLGPFDRLRVECLVIECAGASGDFKGKGHASLLRLFVAATHCQSDGRRTSRGPSITMLR